LKFIGGIAWLSDYVATAAGWQYSKLMLSYNKAMQANTWWQAF